MTLYQLYRRAALLKFLHEVANERAADIDTITERHILSGLKHDAYSGLTRPCQCRTCTWRRCGSRAARVTMDRGYFYAVTRLAAREAMYYEIPWRFELHAERRPRG